MRKEIKFIYFDVGGVAVLDFSKTTKWQDMANDLGVHNDRLNEFSKIYDEYKTQLHTGKIGLDVVQKRLTNDFALDLPSNYDMLTDFVTRFERNTSLCEVVQKLYGSYRLGLLTNMYPGLLNCIKSHDLLPHVDWDIIIDSTEVGLEKPQEEIFVLSEQESKVRPENILFVDNLSENTTAAQKRGWNTFLYDPGNPVTSSRELKEILNN